MDQFVPPVVIQSHDGIGRAAAVWVTTSLHRDIEARAGFDVDDRVRNIAKLRLGALTSRLLYSVTCALAYRSASLYGWIPPDAARDRIKKIKFPLKITK